MCTHYADHRTLEEHIGSEARTGRFAAVGPFDGSRGLGGLKSDAVGASLEASGTSPGEEPLRIRR